MLGGCIGPVKILEVSDMHLLDEASAGYPRKVVQAMNAEGGDLALVCGDLATDGKRAELELAKRVLDELDMPYYPVLGNHDAQHAGTRDETLFAEIFGLEGNSYHFARRGVHFIGFDSGCGTNSSLPATPDALAWLRDTVAGIPAKAPVILFTHYPYAQGVQYEAPSRTEVLETFAGKRLIAVVSGHFHGNTETVQDGILFTTTACSSATRSNHDGSRPKGYRIFHVDRRGRIATEFREVPSGVTLIR
jgi:3',5'-cyclic AMP phosphodiesterase CpdA